MESGAGELWKGLQMELAASTEISAIKDADGFADFLFHEMKLSIMRAQGLK